MQSQARKFMRKKEMIPTLHDVCSNVFQRSRQILENNIIRDRTEEHCIIISYYNHIIILLVILLVISFVCYYDRHATTHFQAVCYKHLKNFLAASWIPKFN